MEVGFAVEPSWWLREEGATQRDEELLSGRPGSLAVTSPEGPGQPEAPRKGGRGLREGEGLAKTSSQRLPAGRM